jgi:cytochrome b6-f complex iron-sulfur subunit
MPDENEQREAAAAKPAARGAVAAAGAGHGVIVVPGERPALPQISRRKVLLIGFWAAMGATLLGIVTTILNSLYPRGITGFGGTVFVGTMDQLEPGKRIHNLDAKAWVVRFNAEQAKRNPGAQEGAVLAVYHKCVHLGCTVPYLEGLSYEDPRNGETYQGWFKCPCHGSTYSDAGVRVFGPAPRSLDTFAMTIKDGKITVNTGKIITGTTENGSRAILPG